MMLSSARSVTLLGICAQLAGFGRTALIAAFFGTNNLVDSYYLALIGPTFISAVIGSWLQMSFIGRYTSLLATDELDLASAYLTRMMILVISCSAIAAAICYWFPETVVSYFVSTSSPEIAFQTSRALSIAGLILIPNIIGDFMGLILNSHGKFAVAAVAPVANAVVSIILLWSWPAHNLSALVWSLLLGAFVQALIIVIALLPLKLRLAIGGKSVMREIRVTILLALPLLPAVMLGNSTTAIIQFRSAQLGEGAVSIYGYASRLHGVLAQVLIIGLGTVLLPHFAALWSKQQNEEIVTLLRRLTRLALLVTGFLTIGVLCFGSLAVQLALGRGAFGASSIQQVSSVWTVLSFSLFPLSLGTFIAKFCQATREALAILLSGVTAFCATWITTYIGLHCGSLYVVAGSAGASAIAGLVFWLFWLRRKVDIAPIIVDMCVGLLLTAAIFIPPAIVAEMALRYISSRVPLVDLLIAGGLYTALATIVFMLFRTRIWFFDPLSRIAA